MRQYGVSMKKPRKVEQVSCFIYQKLIYKYIQERFLSVSTIRNWYNEYHTLLRLYGFDPRFIFNGDETMIEIGEDTHKVAYIDGSVMPAIPATTKMEHITLLLIVSAAGGHVLPLCILPLLCLPMIPLEVSRKFYITGQSKGWINRTIFTNFLLEQFLMHVNMLREKYEDECGPKAPVLLLLDNHNSRDLIDVEAMWQNYGIYIFYLPPHSSAILQPLDLNVNGDFKQKLSKIFNVKMNESLPAKRIRLLIATAKVLTASLSEYSISIGWERSGLFPFSPNKALMSGMILEDSSSEDEAVQEPPRKRGQKFHGKIFHAGKCITEEQEEI